MKSAHAKRWLTVLVVVPVLVLWVWKGGRTGFFLLAALATTAAALEYNQLVLSRGATVVKSAGVAFGLGLVASFFTHGLSFFPILLVVVFYACAVICLAYFRRESFAAEIFYKQITGFIYVPFMLGHVILIRDWEQGVAWTFFLMAVIFAGDTAAFYVGTAMGRHKLAPRISPGKTIEGAVGGLAGNLLVGSVFKKLYFPDYGWAPWMIMVILIGVLGQVGDLYESALKRSVQAKDSGKIMPGHGGLLDRIDALIFAAPGLYYFKTYLM